MLTLFVVLVHLAFLAAAGSHPRRRNVRNSMEFRKRDNLTDDVFHYTNTQLSTTSIPNAKIAKRTGHEPDSPPPKFSVPFKVISDGHAERWVAKISIDVGGKVTESQVLIDTSGFDLWIPNSLEVHGQETFLNSLEVHGQKTLSNSLEVHGRETFSLFLTTETFLGEEVEGIVVSGKVTLGEVESVKYQSFGVATKKPQRFPPRYGNLGLPLTSKSNIHTSDNLLHSILYHNKMTRVFAIHPAGSDFILHLGWIDEKAHTGKIEYHKVIEGSLTWEIQCHIAVRKGPSRRTFKTSNPSSVYIDTGSEYIYGPAKEVQRFYRSIKGKKDKSGPWAYPCNPDLPEVSISLGEIFWPIRFNVGVGHIQNYCVGAIQETDGGPSWRIGKRGLDRVYSVFDVEDMQVGFGELQAHTG